MGLFLNTQSDAFPLEEDGISQAMFSGVPTNLSFDVGAQVNVFVVGYFRP